MDMVLQSINLLYLFAAINGRVTRMLSCCTDSTQIDYESTNFEYYHCCRISSIHAVNHMYVCSPLNSQMLILPQFQGEGHGAQLLEAVHRFYCTLPKVNDITGVCVCVCLYCLCFLRPDDMGKIYHNIGSSIGRHNNI